jgi:hypothetical protein
MRSARGRAWLLALGLAGMGEVVACSLNPQPLPPYTGDNAPGGGEDSGTAEFSDSASGGHKDGGHVPADVIVVPPPPDGSDGPFGSGGDGPYDSGDAEGGMNEAGDADGGNAQD